VGLLRTQIREHLDLKKRNLIQEVGINCIMRSHVGELNVDGKIMKEAD
jgi:hypothetical protein